MSDEALPNINQSFIDEAFSILTSMDLDLDENPLEQGPKRLNKKVAEARRMLSDTESLYLRVSSFLQKYRAAHRTAEVMLDLDKKHLFANDPETRAGRNYATQDSIASHKLRDKVVETANLKNIIEDLEALLTAIKSKRADLKDIQSRLRDQIKLCQEEIGLGGKWGAKKLPEVDLDKAPDVNRKTLRDLQNMFAEVRVSGESFGEMVSIEEPSSPDAIQETKNTTCSVCGKPQFTTPSGIVCENGHGGAPSSEEEPFNTKVSDKDTDSLLDEIDEGEPPKKKGELDIDAILGDLDI